MTITFPQLYESKHCWILTDMAKYPMWGQGKWNPGCFGGTMMSLIMQFPSGFCSAILYEQLSSSKSPRSGKMAAAAPAICSRPEKKGAESGPCKEISQHPCWQTCVYISLATFICNKSSDKYFIARLISISNKIIVSKEKEKMYVDCIVNLQSQS